MRIKLKHERTEAGQQTPEKKKNKNKQHLTKNKKNNKNSVSDIKNFFNESNISLPSNVFIC